MQRSLFALALAGIVASSPALAAAPRKGAAKSSAHKKPPAKSASKKKPTASRSAAKGKSSAAAKGKQVVKAPIKKKHDTITLPLGADVVAEPRVVELREQLQSALREKPLSRSRVGVQVITASDGKVLFDHYGGRLFNPASNTKILSTAAALTELGPDYRYRTRLYGPEPDCDGVVHGDVEVRGAGDPSLVTADLAEIARSLVARGVTKIDGSVIADGRFRDARDNTPGEGGALILNRNTYTIRIHPGEVGHNATLELDPETDFFALHSAVTTVDGKKKNRLRADISREDGKLAVTVRGRINVKSDAVIRRRIGDGATLVAALVRRALIDFGIDVTGGVRGGALAANTPLLCEHESIPLAEICRVSNKDSNNFVADTIFKTVGGERVGGAPSLAKGRIAVRDLMTPIGVEPPEYVIENGSGLTHANRIAPSTLVKLLRHLYFNLTVAPEFLASLAVAGVDGTIRNRFLGSDAVGLVRAKTGTLSGVSALSGYVGDTGEIVIFSILVEGFRHSKLKAIRGAQVRMVLAMLRYLHAGEPPRGAHPAAETPIVVPDDSEDDGDPSDDPMTPPGEAMGNVIGSGGGE